MDKLQSAEEFKESRDGPTSGRLERRSRLREKWDKKNSFPTKRKMAFLSSESITRRALLFFKWRHWLWAVPLCFWHPSMVPQQKEMFRFFWTCYVHTAVPCRWTKCVPVSLIPLLSSHILNVTWAVGNCINADDGSILGIFESVKCIYFNFFPPALPE